MTVYVLFDRMEGRIAVERKGMTLVSRGIMRRTGAKGTKKNTAMRSLTRR